MACITFATDIVPLFRSGDVQCMNARGVGLDNYGYMSDAAGDTDFADHANARHVLARVSSQELPRMPIGAPAWTTEKIDKLRKWIEDGFLP
jgi:hypothetical protein